MLAHGTVYPLLANSLGKGEPVNSHRTRDGLAFPVAAVLAAGLVSFPHHTASIPRVAEVSAIRLQAEVSALVTGVLTATPPAAAAGLPGTGAAATATAPCYYPCTVFDKFIDGLPPKIRNIVLPPLYSITLVITAVLAPVLLVTSAVFGWPYSLRPAAAVPTPKISPAPAAATAATSDQIPTQADPGTSSWVPGDTANAGGDVAVGISDARADNTPRTGARGSTRAEANAIESPEAHASLVTAIADAAPPSAPADDATPSSTATDGAAPVADRPARSRGRSPEAGSADSGPTTTRAAKRSTR